MSNYNKTITMGRLVRAIETRTAPSGTTIATGTVAYDTGWGDNKKANFLDFKAFGKRAEALAGHTDKGDLILLDGELQLEKWETQNGEKRSKLVLYANDFTFLPRSESTTTQFAAATATIGEDEVPF